MKILAFSDLHSDLVTARQLVSKASDDAIELVIGAGDFGTMRKNLQPVINILGQINQPCLWVPGNGESFEELNAACQKFPQIQVLHGHLAQVAGRVFFGLGYAVPVTPFGAWSCDLTEEQAEEKLLDCTDGAILISHSPPLGHVDTNSRGQHVGSQAVLDTITRCRPPLVLCGHVHDCWQQFSEIDNTTIMNLGPRGTVVEI